MTPTSSTANDFWTVLASNLHWIIPCIVSSILSFLLILNAIKQRKIQHQNIKVSLFEKRLALYEEFQAIIGLIIGPGTCTQNDTNNFIRKCRHIEWLFGKEIKDYFHEFQRRTAKLYLIDTKLKHCTDQEKISQLLNEQHEIQNWFILQMNGALFAKFQPYLDLNTIGMENK